MYSFENLFLFSEVNVVLKLQNLKQKSILNVNQCIFLVLLPKKPTDMLLVE